MGLDCGWLEARAESKPPKKFRPEDFEKFLNRQAQHARQRDQMASSLVEGRFVKAPLLPITSLVYIVNGSAYKDRKSAKPDSNAKRPKTSASASYKLMENPKWKDFLGRQQATIQRAQARSMSAPPERGLVIDAEREAGFLQRQKEIVDEKQKHVEAIKSEMIKETMLCTEFARRQHDKSRKQSKDWLAQNGPKGSIAREAKSIEEAKARWKKDYKLEPGESLVLQPKTMTREAAVEFYEKMKEFPNVANRVAPQKPPPYEQTGFRVSGNPYVGGKADKMRLKLGEKAGVDIRL